MNLKVGRAVLSPPRMAKKYRLDRGAVRTPRPTHAGRFRGSMRESCFRGILSPLRGEEEIAPGFLQFIVIGFLFVLLANWFVEEPA